MSTTGCKSTRSRFLDPMDQTISSRIGTHFGPMKSGVLARPGPMMHMEGKDGRNDGFKGPYSGILGPIHHFCHMLDPPRQDLQKGSKKGVQKGSKNGDFRGLDPKDQGPKP